jgi:GNAT superfamily N-acetyltransferase
MDFACESAALNRFLHERALRDSRDSLSTTRVLIESSTGDAVGYFTLAAAAIPFDSISEADRKRWRLSRYPGLSAILLAKLARDKRWKGKGLGGILLAEALRTAHAATAHIGAAFVIVDAADQHATEFYLEFGFTGLDDADHRLFMRMADVERLVKR